MSDEGRDIAPPPPWAAFPARVQERLLWWADHPKLPFELQQTLSHAAAAEKEMAAELQRIRGHVEKARDWLRDEYPSRQTPAEHELEQALKEPTDD